MTNGNDSAYPIVAANGLGHISDGLTKREYFAAMAMQGMIGAHGHVDGFQDAEKHALLSVQYANALINELNKQP